MCQDAFDGFTVAAIGHTLAAANQAIPVKFDDEHVVDLTELDFLSPELAKKIITFLEEEEGESPFRLSPALAVTVGRLLAGPATPQVQKDALWS